MSECRDHVTSLGVKGICLYGILTEQLSKELSKRALWRRCTVTGLVWRTGVCPCVTAVCKVLGV